MISSEPPTRGKSAGKREGWQMYKVLVNDSMNIFAEL